LKKNNMKGYISLQREREQRQRIATPTDFILAIIFVAMLYVIAVGVLSI